MCISFLFKGSIIILRNYGEVKLSEGWLGTYKQIWQKMFVVFGGNIFFCWGPQRNPKSRSFRSSSVPFFFFLLAELFFFLLACYPTPLPFPRCHVCPFITPLLADVLSQTPYSSPLFCYMISARVPCGRTHTTFMEGSLDLDSSC